MNDHDDMVLRPGVLVVGAGSYGVADAAAAARAGVPTLLLARSGDRTGPAARAGAVVLAGSAWGAFRDENGHPEIAVLVGARRVLVQPRCVILAQRRFEAPLPLPGAALPGCAYASGLLEALRRGEIIDGPVALAGDGPVLLVLAEMLLRRGIAVAAVATASAWPVPPSLRRAAVPVLTGILPVMVQGGARAEGLVLRGSDGREHVVGARRVVLHWGTVAETAMARALGAAHRAVAGRLETVVRADGRTTRQDVFVSVGCGASGAAAARSLGATVRLRRRPEPRPVLADPPPIADDAVVCPCEGVTARQVRQAGGSLPAIKRATRAGMGTCGGRFCAGTVARLTAATGEASFAQPRVPLHPVRAGLIMADRPEPADLAVSLPPPTRWLTVPAGPLPSGAEVVVIGGGIVGLSCALHLARNGRDVLLVDRAEPGLAASTANAGSLHVQLVPYVYQERTGGPMAATLPLGPESILLWREIARDAGEDLGLRNEGGLVLAETAAQMALLRSKTAFERARGISAEVVGPTELRRLAPGLGDGFVGAAFCSLEGQGDPLRGTAALMALARRAGVRVAAGVDVLGLAPERTGWILRTATGSFRAGQVVNAAGVQAGRVAALAGVAIPVQALVQQVVVTEALPAVLRQLVAWTGRHLSLKQGKAGHLLIGGGWPGRLLPDGSTAVLRDSLQGNIALAARALPVLREARVVRAWTGLAPHLARGPVISGTPGMPGLWHAVGGNGYTLGPIMGRMVAEAAMQRERPPEAFAL